MSRFWATTESSSSSADSARSDAECPRAGGPPTSAPSSPVRVAGSGGYSTPPRRCVLPTDDPHRAWELAEADQTFLPPPTRAGPPDPSLYTRIVCMSDTHGYHREIAVPRGDVLIHGGDFTNFGEPDMVEDVSRFFGELLRDGSGDGGGPIVGRVVCVAGNHELTFQPERYSRVWRNFHHPGDGRPFDADRARGALRNCAYLEDGSHAYGGVRFYGSPWQPEFHGWAFNLPRTEIIDKWLAVPDDTDVLITHGPPLGRGDRTSDGQRAGCVELMRQVQRRIRPRLHVFGHVHEGHGVSSDGVTLYVNASNVGRDYRKHYPCIVIDLPHDKTLPALLVKPCCHLDAEGLMRWLRSEGCGSLIPFFESATPRVSARDLLAPELFSEICCRLLIHRDDEAVAALKRAIMKLQAESYG